MVERVQDYGGPKERTMDQIHSRFEQKSRQSPWEASCCFLPLIGVSRFLLMEPVRGHGDGKNIEVIE